MRNRFPRNCRIQLGSLENVVLLTGDRKFESISLQRGVRNEPCRYLAACCTCRRLLTVLLPDGQSISVNRRCTATW